MRWLEELTPGRFALLVVAVFMTLTAWAWSYSQPRSPEPDFREQTDGAPIHTTIRSIP